MKISRGLSGLLWCLPAMVVGTPLDAAPPLISRNQPRFNIFNTSALNSFVDEYKSTHTDERLRTRPRPLADDGLISGHEEEASSWCGSEECSPLELFRRQNDPTSTVEVTSTIVRTVTVAPAIATAIIIRTVSETLTFVNPALGTHTSVVTVTAARRRARRMASVPETALGERPAGVQALPTVTLESLAELDALETVLSELGIKVKRQAATTGRRTVTVTSTRTIEITSTVTVPGTVTVTSTIFNTVFVTATVAPSATSTIYTTTTIQPPNPTGNDIAGGVIAPTGGGTISPENPSLLPGGSVLPSGSLSPPGAGANPGLPAGTQVPSGAPGVLPSGQPTQTGNPQTIGPPTEPTETDGPNGPVSPFPGSNLSSDQIAGIVLGGVFFLFLIIVAIFLLIRWSKRKQRKQLAKDHQEMASAASGIVGGAPATVAVAAVTTAGGRSGRTGSTQDRPTLGPSDSSSAPGGEGEVRIVIRPAPKRRTQSSGLLPLGGPSRFPSGASFESSTLGQAGAGRGQWPRPPGYSGQTYSFFIEESGATTPQDPNQWSVASEYGSASQAAASGAETTSNPGGAGGNNPQYPSYSNYSQDERNYTDERDNTGGNGGAGGGEYLTVGRALSPWYAI